jgi:hypothetical protein
VSAQRRSVHPNVPGVPWWGAVMIAVTATAIGFAFDAGGGRDLTHVFAALYIVGCIVAVLMVRQSGLFTAVVQPPMILFVSVPGAYFLFHGAKIAGLKDIVMNCAYPLIERFPLMVLTSSAVLLIGLVRWFVGSKRSVGDEVPTRTTTTGTTTTGTTTTGTTTTGTTTTGPFAAVTAKLGEIFSRSHDDEEPVPKHRHAVDRPKPTRAAQPTTTATRAEPARPRRPRPPLDDDLPPERSRRRTPPSWQPEEPVELPRRRPPAARTARNPYDRREPYERRVPRDRRNDRRGRHDSYDPFDPYEAPPRRHPEPRGAAVTNGTHHPISRVRYRGSAPDADAWQERPVRSRSRSSEAEGWEYDI